MFSAVFCVGYFILIGTINVFGSVQFIEFNNGELDTRRELKLSYPFYFGYYIGQSLNMKITLKNIPSHLKVELRYDGDISVTKCEDTAELNEKCFHCVGVLEHEMFFIDVNLYNDFGLCTKKVITEGNYIPKNTLGKNIRNSDDFKYNDACLTVLPPCAIEVDLENECAVLGRSFLGNGLNNNSPEESGTIQQRIKSFLVKYFKWPTFSPKEKPIPIESKCYREREKYVCTSQTALKGVIIQKWYQDYGNKTKVISFIPPLKAKRTKIVMTLEEFDNNTEIVFTLTNKKLKVLTAERRKIYLLANESGQYSNVATLKYGITKEVRFDCQNFLNGTKYVQIGIINTANRISTYDEKLINKTFNMADNGTILCCLLHFIYNDAVELEVQRFVQKKTRLVFDELLDFVPRPTGISEPSSIFKDSLVYIVVSIAVIIVAFLVIFIFIKKYYCKNPNPDEAVELNTYNSSDAVLYADLDFVGGNVQSTKPDEESKYAEIIGELKPFQRK